MSPTFTINFRREAYLRQIAHARRRLVMLGVWLTYFGVLGLIIGLYGLNCASLQNRTRQLELQASRLRAQVATQEWAVDAAQLAVVERYQANPGRWRDKLVRLATLIPPNAVLTSLAVNPENLSNPSDQNRLVIIGQFRPAPGQDRMRAAVEFTSALHDDSVFAAGYVNIRLVSSRTMEGSPPVTEFVIECR